MMMKPIKVKTTRKKKLELLVNSPPEYKWTFKIYNTKLPTPVQNKKLSFLDYIDFTIMSICFILSTLFLIISLFGD